jgi:HTH-type transcriptional regulator / antitoxin HipB
VIYPIKTLSQLPLLLKSFRKEKGLTQAAMAEKLGITQQSYAYFEANPATATLERLYMVLRLLDVEISLNRDPPGTTVSAVGQASGTSKAVGISGTACRKERW